MTTLELFEKYGRRFALCDFGDNGYFDFFEIKAVKNEPPIIKNVKIILYGKEDIRISEEPDLEIYDLELVLQSYSFLEIINLAGEDKISKLLRDFRADCDRLYPMLIENKVSDEFFKIKNRVLKTAKAIEEYFEPEPNRPNRAKANFDFSNKKSFEKGFFFASVYVKIVAEFILFLKEREKCLKKLLRKRRMFWLKKTRWRSF